MLNEIAAFTTICGLMTAFLSVIVAAVRAWVIPQSTESLRWAAIEAGALVAAVATGVLGLYVAMSGQWEFVSQAAGLIAGLALVAFGAAMYVLGKLHRRRKLNQVKEA